jgi:ribosomal protein L34E
MTNDERQPENLIKIKTCNVCGKEFNCNAADIANCQCYAVKVPGDIAAIISKRYADCLCAQCLQEIIQEETLQKGQDNL